MAGPQEQTRTKKPDASSVGLFLLLSMCWLQPLLSLQGPHYVLVSLQSREDASGSSLCACHLERRDLFSLSIPVLIPGKGFG